MKEYSVRKYEPADFQQWNAFIEKARNATFLFQRDFVEYHANRFSDFSLLVFESGKLVAAVPGNRADNDFYSHQGLTYGGLILLPHTSAIAISEMFSAILSFLKSESVDKMFIKSMPLFYSRQPGFELEYFLVKNGAELIRREMNLAIDFNSGFSVSGSKRKHFRRVSDLGMEIRQEQQFAEFWNNVLSPRLLTKHNTSPVHSLAEIELLAMKFPRNIFQFNVYFEDEILAGITLFDFGNGVKSQYGATTALGEKMRALDFLFITLIEDFSAKKYSFFDMGTVSENNDLGYNPGLLTQKQELGCSVYNQDQYLLKL